MSERGLAGVPRKRLRSHEAGSSGQGRAPQGEVFDPPDQTEIRQLGLSVRSHEHIGRLDVAMDQSRVVGGPQGQHDLPGQIGAAPARAGLAAPYLAQRLTAGYIFHLDEMEPLGVPRLWTVPREDAPGWRPRGFRPELLAEARLFFAPIRIHHLQRRAGAGPGVLPCKHTPSSPAPAPTRCDTARPGDRRGAASQQGAGPSTSAALGASFSTVSSIPFTSITRPGRSGRSGPAGSFRPPQYRARPPGVRFRLGGSGTLGRGC